jgi:hypothetical protein
MRDKGLRDMSIVKDRESIFNLDEIISLYSRTPTDGKIDGQFYEGCDRLEIILCLANEIRKLKYELKQIKMTES